MAKYLSNLQAVHFEHKSGEPLRSIWNEADVVEGLTVALRRLVTEVEKTDLDEHPVAYRIGAAARAAVNVLETAEQWERPVCTPCGGTGKDLGAGQGIVDCVACKGSGHQ